MICEFSDQYLDSAFGGSECLKARTAQVNKELPIEVEHETIEEHEVEQEMQRFMMKLSFILFAFMFGINFLYSAFSFTR